jgi:hypothetical protein
MPALVAGIPLRPAGRCHRDRDDRDKLGHMTPAEIRAGDFYAWLRENYSSHSANLGIRIPTGRNARKNGLTRSSIAHARLGNEVAALACCAQLPDDFWTPGFEGAPGGGKAEIADELRRRAAQARRERQ